MNEQVAEKHWTLADDERAFFHQAGVSALHMEHWLNERMARAWEEGYLHADEDYNSWLNGERGERFEQVLEANPYRTASPAKGRSPFSTCCLHVGTDQCACDDPTPTLAGCEKCMDGEDLDWGWACDHCWREGVER